MPDTYLFPLEDHVGETLHVEAGRTSDLTPQRQVMAQHTPSSPDRNPLDTLRALLLNNAAPFADAYERYSAEEAAHLAKFGDEAMLGNGEPEADFSIISKRFRDAAATAQPPATMRDALAVIRYARDDEDEETAPITLDTEDKLRLLRGACSTVAAVMEAGRALIEQADSPSTAIPEIGMTFQQAADRVKELLEWNEASYARDEDDDGPESAQRNANAEAWRQLEDAIFETPAQNFRDVLAKLERLACPALGAGAFEVTPEQIKGIAADIRRIGTKPALLNLPGDGSTIIPGLGMTFAEAVERHAALIAEAIAIDYKEGPTTEADRARSLELCNQWVDIEEAVSAAEPVTVADAQAVLRIASHDGSPLRDGEFVSPCHNAAAMFSATLRAATMIATVPDDHPDSELLSLFRQWVENENQYDAGPLSDDEADAVGEVCHRLMMEIATLPARTVVGICIKVYAREHWRNGAPVGKRSTAVRLPEPGSDRVDSAFQHSLFNDALRLMPELNVLMRDKASSAPIAARNTAVNPDADILSAFRTFSDAYRRIDSIQDDKSPEQEAAYQEMYGAWDKVADSMPQTAAGLAVYLKLAFRNIAESLQADRAVIYGEPLEEGGLNYFGEKMLWKLIQHLEGVDVALCTAPPLAHLDRQQPDAFADTISAFQGEAEEALSLPTAPTVDMLEAGAAAAGIDIEQARAIYAAMAEAYKKEAA